MGAAAQRLAFLVFATLLLAACGTDHEAALRVDLRTDMAPGEEFDAVSVFLGDGDASRSFSHVVQLSGDYVQGIRLGDFGIERGDHIIRAVLFRAGREVTTRRAEVRVEDAITAVTLVVTRDCRGVMCPGTGDDPVASSCLGGRCVDPRCTPETPEYCPAGECMVASDCSHACADASCATGACLYEPDDAACDMGQMCTLDEGCVSAPRDAGTDAGGMDAMTPDSGPDAGPPDVGVDGGPIDVGNDIPMDAGPPSCQGPDGETLFYFDFESDNDLVGDAASRFRGGASRGAGDSPCGGGVLQMPTAGTGHVWSVANQSAFAVSEGSFDFWMKRPRNAQASAVFSRDELGRGSDGHITMFFSEENALAIRAQHLNDGSDQVVCSTVIPSDTWVRVGVNFGAAGIELWVDGVLQNRTGIEVIAATPSDLVCGANARGHSLAGNANPWALGGSIHLSEPGADLPTDHPALGFEFDEFRLSRVHRDYSALQ